jgi:cation diffusion facilitator family transporter
LTRAGDVRTLTGTSGLRDGPAMTTSPAMGPTSHEKQRLTIVFVTAAGALVNLMLAAAKICIGLTALSQALVADGIHSLSDLVTDAVVLVGAAWWTRPPDALHPYGHGRAETLVNLFIGFALAATAAGIVYKGLISMTSGEVTHLEWPALVVAGISVTTKEWLFRWTARRGQQVGSSALVANAWHHRSDALSSVPVLVAVITSWLFPALVFVDQVAAILVAAMLLRAAWNIARPSLNEILETSQDPRLATRVADLAAGFPEIASVHRIRCRRVGGATFVDLHMLLDPKTPVAVAHETAHRFQAAVREDQPQVVEVNAHIEPATPEQMGDWQADQPHPKTTSSPE